MNPSRLLVIKPRLTAAVLLTGCLAVSSLSAQNYMPHPAYGVVQTSAWQPYGMPQMAMPAGYRRSPQLAGPYYQQCPPGYQPPSYCPPRSSTETMPQPPQPGTTQQGNTTQTPQSQPSDQTQNQQNQQTQQQQNQQNQPSDFTPSPDSSGRASLSPGMNTPQLGRNDQSNRLNLFDNMSAAPQSRVWFGFQFAQHFDTGLQLTSGFQSFLSAYPQYSLNDLLLRNTGVNGNFFQYDQRLYRVGGEWAPCNYFSVAVQGQYVAPNGDFPNTPPDDWTNPQIMTKTVLYRDYDTIITSTLGITPETHNDFAEINEHVTKIYPGFLFYEGLTQNLFTQGGAQLDVPVRGHNEVYTADWSLALGYWLYRDNCACGHGCCDRCCDHDCCDRPHFLRCLGITGIIPQINVLGKHVVGSNTILGPFGFANSAGFVNVGETTTVYAACDPVTGLPIPGLLIPVTTPTNIAFPLPEGFVIYKEPRDILDLTVGGQIQFGNHVQVGLGYSVPLTDNSVRKNEFLSTLTYLF